MCLTHFLSHYEKAHFCVVTALLLIIAYATLHISNLHSRLMLHCLWLNSHYLAELLKCKEIILDFWTCYSLRYLFTMANRTFYYQVKCVCYLYYLPVAGNLGNSGDLRKKGDCCQPGTMEEKLLSSLAFPKSSERPSEDMVGEPCD